MPHTGHLEVTEYHHVTTVEDNALPWLLLMSVSQCGYSLRTMPHRGKLEVSITKWLLLRMPHPGYSDVSITIVWLFLQDNATPWLIGGQWLFLRMMPHPGGGNLEATLGTTLGTLPILVVSITMWSQLLRTMSQPVSITIWQPGCPDYLQGRSQPSCSGSQSHKRTTPWVIVPTWYGTMFCHNWTCLGVFWGRSQILQVNFITRLDWRYCQNNFVPH
jgi:hypothetical protein